MYLTMTLKKRMFNSTKTWEKLWLLFILCYSKEHQMYLNKYQISIEFNYITLLLKWSKKLFVIQLKILNLNRSLFVNKRKLFNLILLKQQQTCLLYKFNFKLLIVLNVQEKTKINYGWHQSYCTMLTRSLPQIHWNFWIFIENFKRHCASQFIILNLFIH